MRVGMSLSSTSNLPSRDAARHLLARVRAARDAGLDTLTFGDSHGRSSVRYFQNVPTLGRALAEWDPARPAGCLFLAPMWSPVLMAEQIGTLAAFHDGPFIVQTGLGGGPEQFAAVGAPYRPRGAALEEAVEIVNALFAGETVSSVRYGIENAAIGLVPPDGITWWMGTMAPTGIERAARFGATWYASHGASIALLPELLGVYRSACSAAGTSPSIALRRDAIVLADGDRARAEARASLSRGYRGMTSEMIVAGTPDDVAEQLAPIRDLGIDEVMIRTMGVDSDADLETIELLGSVRDMLR
jgi:alkanesulfonate monooxygenase SsuD/methylene tetrahydromethanopterin reductase-like flavin-dependent oxidoreductase (luciferase family)